MNEGVFPVDMEFTIDDDVFVIATCNRQNSIAFSAAVVLAATTAAAATIITLF